MNQEKNAGLSFSLLVLFVVLLLNTAVNAQTKPLYQIRQAKQIMVLMDAVRKNKPVEKLYLQLDKFNYLAGDTLWFKAYLLEGPYLQPSTKSGIIYVELVSPDNRLIKRLKFPANYGLSWGNIGLDETGLPTGNYLLRAYTTWMLNFGEAAAFTTNIYINNAKIPPVSASLKQTAKADGLPAATTGTATSLIINNAPEKTELEVALTADGAARDAQGYYLVGQSRGVVCYAVSVSLKEGKLVNKIAKSLFPTGIARFTLIDKNLQSLNERMIYIDQQDQLKLDISSAQTTYKSRDSIALRIRVTDKNNEPVQGSFSMAVTDDNQVVQTKPKKGNLNTYMVLASELINQDKDADAYTNGTVAAQQKLDSLARISGWLGYHWNEALNKEPKYKAEPEFMITGRVSSTFSGMGEAKLSLFVKKPLLFKDTVAGPDGRFVFKNLPIADTAVYKIQATNKKGKNFFVNLEVDEWVPPVFSPLTVDYSTTAALKDTALMQKVEKAIALKQQQGKSSGTLLNEVNIAAKKLVKGSYNLNGSGEADQVLTENDLLKEGKKPLYALLMARIPGLSVGSYVFPPSKRRKFGLMLKNQLVKVIMDGIDMDQTYEYWQLMADTDDSAEGLEERFQHIKSGLENFNAEDVKGIEVMYNASYNVKYNNKFLSLAESSFNGRSGLSGVGGASGIDYTYIEITTRSGKGPAKKQTPGTYLYKPLAFSLPTKFHSPKYLNKEISGTDIRSTIHWEPNIITNEKGEATISFHAADLPASYTVVIEGSDMNGGMGSVIKPAYIKIAP